MSNVHRAGTPGKSPVIPPEAEPYAVWLAMGRITGQGEFVIGYMITAAADPNTPLAFVHMDPGLATPLEEEIIWNRVRSLATRLPDTTDGSWVDLRRCGGLEGAEPVPDFCFGLRLAEVDANGKDKGENRWIMEPFCAVKLRDMLDREQILRERADTSPPYSLPDARNRSKNGRLVVPGDIVVSEGPEVGRVTCLDRGIAVVERLWPEVTDQTRQLTRGFEAKNLVVVACGGPSAAVETPHQSNGDGKKPAQAGVRSSGKAKG